MPYTPMAMSKPISGDNGPTLVSTTANSLQVLRDCVLTSGSCGWAYSRAVGTGTNEEPQYRYWKLTTGGVTEEIRATHTWGTYGPTVITWEYRVSATASYQLIGTETTTWATDGTITTVVWSGTVTYPVFNDAKPITGTDHSLLTVTYIRQNLMALRDMASVGYFTEDWDYSWTGGTSELPTYYIWEKGAGPERIMSLNTWTAEKLTSMVWTYRPTSASGYEAMGTQTFTYDADDNLTSSVWSVTPARLSFENDRPIISEADANDIIVDIKNNMLALRDGLVMGSIHGWTLTPSGGLAYQPQYLTHSNGTLRLRTTLTYGTTGNEIDSVTQEVLEYSTDSGTIYTAIGTIQHTYSAGGILETSIWV